MNQYLNIAILPSKTINFEWTDTKNVLDKSTQTIQDTVFRASLKDKDKALFLCGLIDEKILLSPTLLFWRRVSREYTKNLLLASDIEERRETIKIPLEFELIQSVLESSPPMVGFEFLDESLLKKYWKLLHENFCREIVLHSGTVESLIKKLTPNHSISNRIHFHLVENRKNEENPFAFMTTYSTFSDNKNVMKHVPLQHALNEYKGNKKKLLNLLSIIHRVAKKSPLIDELLGEGDLFHPIVFSTEDAYTFLNEVSLYEQHGILCRIPRWWKANPQKISVGVSIGNKSSGKVGSDAIIDFKICLNIDGEEISATDAQNILDQYSGLVFFKGKWVAVDTESLQKSIDLFKEAKMLAKDCEITLSEAMQMLMGSSDKIDALGIKNTDIIYGDWLKSVLKKMSDPKLLRSIKPGKNLLATLRPYQQHGLNWLYFLHSLGFGMCLADDMGLGKTIQVLALLLILKENKKKEFKTSLLIVPASLLTNWQQEIDKFTPSLRVVIAHSQMSDKKTINSLVDNLKDWDLVITTYAFARKTVWLKEVGWFYTILDEAQAIKNISSAQTREIKKIKCKNKLVLTGTPVENRLTDLWSIYDFINPGLLGSAKKFSSFIKNCEKNSELYSHLRKVIQPYILRRLKTDKSIISDLPDKTEMKCYATLSKNQAVLYSNLVKEFKENLENSDGIKRKGIVLGYLMKFKQLCNHPDQLTGQNEYEEKLSGKFSRLRNICEIIYEKREKVLVFTQFREIIEPINIFLKSIFNGDGLVLHGQTSIKKRREYVTRFQSDEYIPYFVLSLRAAGVGLNLTAANHVIHFDRWWNPAVENQATDRAFRIGQNKNVVVHKFICKGTIEEKIDAMVDDKKEMSDRILSGNTENWLTEMNTEELLNMFKLTIN